MDFRIELLMQLVVLFITVFYSTKWFKESQPAWDQTLALVSVGLGIFLGWKS